MDIISETKKEFIESLIQKMVTPNTKVKEKGQSPDDLNTYRVFIEQALCIEGSKELTVKLPIDFALKSDMFRLLKEQKVFISSSVKFVATFTTSRPKYEDPYEFVAKYRGNEFAYSFLDNHSGIINVNKLKDIPVDYEGLIAVPLTILEYKNMVRFNIHRIIYSPRHLGKFIYPRIVISNKVVSTDE